MKVCQYILKTIQNLDKVLINVECTDRSVSDEKSQYIMKQLKIVEFVCRSNECSSVINKVLKIVQWRSCQNLKEAHAFIGLCVYYWLWINWFVIISSSIYDLFKKNVVFLWMSKQQQIMNKLKILLSTELIIQQLDCDSDAKDIILTVNLSKKEWEFCLMQKVKNDWCCYVCQYDSGVWTNAKSRYDTDKWECHRLLKALKKVHAYLYKVFFIVELNAQTLISQLNRSAVDIFDAFINCWITWIQLFDFDILHVSDKKHQALNTLSQHSQTEDETDFDNSDIEDFLNSWLFYSSVWVYLVSTEHVMSQKLKLIITSVLNPESEYSEDQIVITTYLVTLQHLTDIQGKKFTKFKTEALKHIVQDMKLFHCSSKNMRIHRVVNKEENQTEII